MRWDINRLSLEQMMLLSLIHTYYPKLMEHNPQQRTKVLALIAYFYHIDVRYLRSVFDTFSQEQKEDVSAVYGIPLVIPEEPEMRVEF